MTIIKNLVEQIDDELCSAKEYAEKYVEYKSKNDMPWANRFKEMANEELKHATYIHDLAVAKIEEFSSTFQPTQSMQDKWDKSHAEYVEKEAWIKQMLSM